jgi:hypothetical protein
MDSEESVGMADDNMGPPTAATVKTLRRPLSPIPEVGATSRASTPKRPQSLTPVGVVGTSGSKRPRAFEASESSAKIQLERANWTIEGKLAKLRGDLEGNPFKAMVDLIDHEKLQMKRDVSAQGMAEEMLSFQFLVSVIAFAFFSFHSDFLYNTVFLQLQGFLRSLLIYYYFRKVSSTEEAKTSRRRLEEAEGENAKLKEAVAKMEEELRVFGQHSADMECEASDDTKAKDRAEAGLAKLSEEFKGLQAKHAELQEGHAILQAEHAELQKDHSILKEDLGQLEKKHSETLEQLKERQALVDRAVASRVVAEEKYQHFNGLYKKMRLMLKEAKVKAANYLHQQSFASRVRDIAWADGIHLGFETFWTWWRDPAQKVDLNQVNIEDIPCTNEAIRCLTSLGQEEMPDAIRIADFDYHPPAHDFEAVSEGGEAREASEDAEATPAGQDPLLLLRGEIR